MTTENRSKWSCLLLQRHLADQSYREGRRYEDYESFISNTGLSALEMDTVKGRREKGKRLLTMIFQNSTIMLLFLMPDGKAESVKRVFDYLERGWGQSVFSVCSRSSSRTTEASSRKSKPWSSRKITRSVRMSFSVTRWHRGRSLTSKRTMSTSVTYFPEAKALILTRRKTSRC